MLLLILFLSMIVLIVVLWAGTFFFQGYIYTEPSPGIFWQAPAAGVFLTFGYVIWTMAVAFSNPASPTVSSNPLLFSPKVDMLERPAKRLTAIKLNRKKSVEGKDGEKVVYVRKTDSPTKVHYETPTAKPHPWHGQEVIAIEIEKDDGTKLRFDLQETEEGGYKDFASADGWIMREYDGPTGLPFKYSFWRLVVNVFFNVFHFIGWFLALWLILRFQWSHALGFAVVMWVVISLTFLPMILGYAAEVAAASQGMRTASIRIESILWLT